MHFMFDHTAESRVIKFLTIVDDATHEAVTIEVERAAGIAAGHQNRQRQGILWKGYGGMDSRRGSGPALIEPGKTNQNTFVESFNGRLRDECLNEHWFPTLLHTRTSIESWRRDYNEERPKRALGGLRPQYAAQLAAKKDNISTVL